jgi:hypothetical protein
MPLLLGTGKPASAFDLEKKASMVAGEAILNAIRTVNLMFDPKVCAVRPIVRAVTD